MDVNSLLQFGLGAALIGFFFIPYINSLNKRLAEKDAEISQLNKEIQTILQQRAGDMREVVGQVVEPMRQFKGTAEALFNLVQRKHDE